jgi:hypothetical protein
VFANNRVSSTLDKGKPSSALFAKYVSGLDCFSKCAEFAKPSREVNRVLRSRGFGGTHVTFTVYEPFNTCLSFIRAEVGGKSGAYLADSLLKNDGTIPFKLGFATDKPTFGWFQAPENGYYLSRFAVAMQGTAATEPPELIFQGAIFPSW